MRPQLRGRLGIAVCGLLLLLISGVAAAGAAVTDSSIAISNAAADGEPFPVPANPDHVWVAGDVFSLHGVDQYRYVVVYTRDTADGIVHGCYEVDEATSGRYEVTQYVHGQEVFGNAFLAEQGAKFLENVPLGDIMITDDTPGNNGQSYFGMTLGSIFGGANAPSPEETPQPIPTAAHWPTLAPTQATPTPAAAPTGVVSVTQTPGPEPTVPFDASPFPMPTVNPTVVLPVVTEPTETPALVPGSVAPVLEPTVTLAPPPIWGKRFATWQAPSTSGRRVGAGISPEPTVTIGAKAARTVRSYGRVYPPWSLFARSTA